MEEKPTIAGKTPIILDMEEGKTYAWCACGQSQNQPFCDGSHKGTAFTPVVFKSEGGKAALCMCKSSAGKPFCDGSHKHV